MRDETAGEGVARTIARQIGGRAMYMLGARNLIDCGNSLCFKVGRNAKGVTHIRIELDPTDTYNVEFIRQGRAPAFKVTRLSEHSLIYVDQLHSLIESETGLRTSL